MSGPRTTTPRASHLADLLIADIEKRGLKAGDRYLTTAEASTMLGVGNGAANLALQVLERRRRIIRQQRRGAFVLDPPVVPAEPALHRVHFLVHQKYLRAEGVGQDESLLGIERELPGVPVQISFLPADNEAAFVAELLAESVRAKRRVGFVLVRASYETQRLVADSKVPAVVNGSVYPSIEGLASLTFDMRRAGELLASSLLERGHERLAYINRQITYGGDQLTIEGIFSALHARGKGLESIALRFLPTANEVYGAEARRLLTQAQRPTGFICRTVRMADEVMAAAKSLGLRPEKDFAVCVCDYYQQSNELPRYAWAKPLISSEELGRRLAKLLIRQSQGGESVSGIEIVPVELEIPIDAGCTSH